MPIYCTAHNNALLIIRLDVDHGVRKRSECGWKRIIRISRRGGSGGTTRAVREIGKL